MKWGEEGVGSLGAVVILFGDVALLSHDGSGSCRCWVPSIAVGEYYV